MSDWEARFATARVVAGTAGPYFLGPEPCLADIAVLPFLVRFDVLLQVRCVPVPTGALLLAVGWHCHSNFKADLSCLFVVFKLLV